MALLQLPFRLPYKVSRSSQYWKKDRPTIRTRIERLLQAFGKIRRALDQEIAGIILPLPAAAQVPSLAALKPLEDSLDALICAWVGIEHLAGRTLGLGDNTAAIWCPEGAFQRAAGGESEQTLGSHPTRFLENLPAGSAKRPQRRQLLRERLGAPRGERR